MGNSIDLHFQAQGFSLGFGAILCHLERRNVQDMARGGQPAQEARESRVFARNIALKRFLASPGGAVRIRAARTGDGGRGSGLCRGAPLLAVPDLHAPDFRSGPAGKARELVGNLGAPSALRGDHPNFGGFERKAAFFGETARNLCHLAALRHQRRLRGGQRSAAASAARLLHRP